MIFYSWPWGYRRHWLWLPGLDSVITACWIVFVWPLLAIFWMTVWGFALVGWIMAEFYLLLISLGIMAYVGWVRRLPFETHLARPWRTPLWAVVVTELDPW
jgi:hypothetical protein